MMPDEKNELSEAVAAGRRALASLERAAGALEGASNWGAFDLFLGGAISSLIKHARLGGAREALEAARDDLYVQKKIEDARDDVAAAIRATRTVLARLEAAR